MTAVMRRAHLRPLATVACALVLTWSAPAADEAVRLAGDVRRVIAGAVQPPGPAASPERVLGSSLGANLQDYARQPAGEPAHFESTTEAARRVLAGEAPARTTPADTARWLESAATTLLAAGGGADERARELRVHGHLARFHARRLLAAMHLNLFKRGLRLAELVAATYGEKDAVAAWHELVRDAADHPLASAWRTEAKGLQASLRELEEQCCPPDEAVLKEKVWDPASDRGRPPPGSGVASPRETS